MSVTDKTNRARSQLCAIDANDGLPTCVVCGQWLNDEDDLKIFCAPRETGYGYLAVVHAACAEEVKRTRQAPPSSLRLTPDAEGITQRWVLPDGVPDNAPIFWNGLLQLDGSCFVRFGRSIVFLGRAPSQGCLVTTLSGGVAQ
ncbi:MAG: hypothetical protein EB084_25535 [Proteobacteria bacterium]|nr:hypothetical protein [Pseudomonadota bacterium]